MTDKPDVPIGDIEQFLVAWHGRPVDSLAPLPGGFWSAAYGYRVADQDLVLRLGTIPEGFDADRAAMAFDAPDLPVPKIVAIGHAFNVGYAISERHHGRFLEDKDASSVTGVFSWKHSMRGDFVWDTAYCTFFSSWYPGVGAADPWTATLATLTPAQWADVGARHHCYELTIGARRLGDYLVTNDEPNLQIAQQRLTEILERGPLPESLIAPRCQQPPNSDDR